MNEEIQPLLVPYKCDKCGKTIAWTLPGATVCCNKCGKWVDSLKVKSADTAVTA